MVTIDICRRTDPLPEPKSKRVPVRLREKIHKCSAAKQRKGRKEAKKDVTWKSKLKKDPGIPNLFPFKDQILQEIEEKRKIREEDNARRRELAKAQRRGGGEAAEADAMEDSEEEFERFDLEGSEGDSEEEDSMMVVSFALLLNSSGANTDAG